MYSIGASYSGAKVAVSAMGRNCDRRCGKSILSRTTISRAAMRPGTFAAARTGHSAAQLAHVILALGARLRERGMAIKRRGLLAGSAALWIGAPAIVRAQPAVHVGHGFAMHGEPKFAPPPQPPH